MDTRAVLGDLLCTTHARPTLEDIFEDHDLTPNSTADDLLRSKASYACLLPVYYATHLEMTIDPTYIGLIRDHKNEYLLARAGIYNLNEPFMRLDGKVRLHDTNYICHGDRHVVIIDEGYLGLCLDNGENKLLWAGVHAWTSHTMHFIRQVSMAGDVLELGPYKLVTVMDGYVALVSWGCGGIGGRHRHLPTTDRAKR